MTDSKTGYCEEHRSLMQRHYEHFARGYNQHERYGSGWRKMRPLRASDAEWELIKKFAAMVKGDIDQAMRMIETK